MQTGSPSPRNDARRQPRLRVPAMYTLIRAREAGSRRYTWTGHIYDISRTGMRFELDEAIKPGTEIEVRGLLPGANHVTFRATGNVVRLHGDEEPGPTRMAMAFTRFGQVHDEQRVDDYLTQRGLSRAA